MFTVQIQIEEIVNLNSEKETSKQVNNLVIEARNGSQEAFEYLVYKYEPLIESLVSKYYDENIVGLNKEDLKQEAVLKLYKSILSYDTEQSEVEFGLYAKICISNALVSQIRLYKQKVSEPLNESLETACGMLEAQDPSERILEEERVAALYSLIRSNLSPYEYKVWRLYVSGKSAKDISCIVGVDEKSVSNAIYRIRKKLRERLV